MASCSSTRIRQPEDLTDREQEILLLIWSGLKNKEIGHKLKISVKTIEAHRANMGQYDEEDASIQHRSPIKNRHPRRASASVSHKFLKMLISRQP
jgi:FixJ family two-component response regulator